jgi:hypothetical protein
MAQAFVMTTTELWVGDRRALWVVLADTADLALETARTDGCNVDGVSERCPRRRCSEITGLDCGPGQTEDGAEAAR